MILGKTDRFAIEIGQLELYPEASGLFVQFRFWVANFPVGDWDDRIPLGASIDTACLIRNTEWARQLSPFAPSLPDDMFRAVYDAFFAYDYSKDPVEAPNLRDRFHLDDIGLGAIQDKYGLILVVSLEGLERVIVKDLRQEQFIADVSMPLGFVESVLNEYIEWGRTKLLAARS
ncbi:hypothetical protein KIH39_08020 [Telmatocola sphagniphila]|jgi:hypothetical protein|uniref:Uncharacterized protein n=1 Tax=Telmatocola sphagniphila TaxID=1123043 RepID=A0A8E6B8R9_9BACT|nr:hypothetical protein [Telmatocola sphagniphila]QVL33841.1 hypothetical protein KIH39_08020 [Telmatocola sphagniphila]